MIGYLLRVMSSLVAKRVFLGVVRNNIQCLLLLLRRSTSFLEVQECVWLRQLIEVIYFSIHKLTIIQVDNQNAFMLATNPVCHARTKKY